MGLWGWKIIPVPIPMGISMGIPIRTAALVESVLEKKRKATVGRIYRKGRF